MAKIIVENYKEHTTDEDKIIHVKGWQAYSPDKAALVLKRVLTAYKAMWPDDEKLSKVHIIELP